MAARLLVSLLMTIGAGVSSAFAQTPSTLKLETGKQIYEAGCVSCHGPDGKGQPRSLSGFEPPDTFPDFSDCPTSTPEADVQWRAIISNGGKARAFSTIMPSFKDLLTDEQIVKVIEHLRSLCTENAWPRGNLNLPRPMFTEKAFPENETVLAGALNATGSPGVATTVTYERRIGATAMFEVGLPYSFTHEDGSWGAAFGDLTLGYKQTLFHSLKSGSILSVGGELAVPTGSISHGTGGESTVFEAFTALGQLFRGDSFVQVHTGVELPAHPDDVPRAYFLRTAIGKTFSAEQGLGRRWTPMIEFIADRDLVSNAATNWDVVPEVQIPMSKRMHVLGSVGIRLPINNTDNRQKQVMFYLLWDWVDGGLLQGW